MFNCKETDSPYKKGFQIKKCSNLLLFMHNYRLQVIVEVGHSQVRGVEAIMEDSHIEMQLEFSLF